MEPIRKAKEDKIEKFNQLKNLNGEEFRKALIEWTKESKTIEDDISKVTLNGLPINKHELFLSKKEDALSFCQELLDKTKGRVKFNPNDAIIVPQKLVLSGEKINKLSKKDTLSAEEVDDLINTYKKLFESIKKILEPYFKAILNNSGFVNWSDISKEIKNFNNKYDKLFSSMNGTLRDAVAHESSYTEKDLFIWILEDGTEREYSLEKVFKKIYDLIFLIIVLYWAQSEIQIEYVIKFYESAPLDKLKDAVTKIF